MTALMHKYWKIILALLAIFLSGKAIGYTVATMQHSSPTGPVYGVETTPAKLDWQEQTISGLESRLQLTPTQKDKLRPIVKETSDKVWSERPKRFWLHTCNLDHPAALKLYQKVGFVLYDEENFRREY